MEIETKAIKFSGTKVQDMLSELIGMLTKQNSYYLAKRDKTPDLNEFTAWEQMLKRNESALRMLQQCTELLRWN